MSILYLICNFPNIQRIMGGTKTNDIIVSFEPKEIDCAKKLIEILNAILEVLKKSSIRKALEHFFIRYILDKKLDEVIYLTI